MLALLRGASDDGKFEIQNSRCEASAKPITHGEIIEDLEDHLRKFGGERREWCVGTAKDARAPFFRRHLTADTGDGLIYREAFTTTAADQVIDHMVNRDGLRPDRDSVPEPGKIVFVYGQTNAEGSQRSPTRREWAFADGLAVITRSPEAITVVPT